MTTTMMRLSTFSTTCCSSKQKAVQPLIKFPSSSNLINLDQLMIDHQQRPNNNNNNKNKVVVVVGSTGSGKSRLSIDLATQFDAEIINSDKIQVYRGLNIATNKLTLNQTRGIPHHLLGILDPDSDFSPRDFVKRATAATDSITRRHRLPIIAGGSNSCIRALVADDPYFRSNFDCCFLWVDASIPVLHSAVARRVDEMLVNGLVDESREFYEPGGDYTRGIRQAIGVPEMDEFFRNEGFADRATRARMLEVAIRKIKANTCDLASRQMKNILRLEEGLQCRVHRLNATEVLLKHGREDEADEAWRRLVSGPSMKIVRRFLCRDDVNNNNHMGFVRPTKAAATAAARATTTNYY